MCAHLIRRTDKWNKRQMHVNDCWWWEIVAPKLKEEEEEKKIKAKRTSHKLWNTNCPQLDIGYDTPTANNCIISYKSQYKLFENR